MSLFSKIRGITETMLQIGKGGPQIKANVAAIEMRNSTDAAFAIARGATAAHDGKVSVVRSTLTVVALAPGVSIVRLGHASTMGPPSDLINVTVVVS